MTQLVDDLLDVSRINHGRLHLRPERIDLRVVVSNAIETLESDINERHHRLSTALPDAPVWLQADPWRLEQVFVNLLANASRYTDAGLALVRNLVELHGGSVTAASAGIRQGSEFTVHLPRKPLKTTSRTADR